MDDDKLQAIKAAKPGMTVTFIRFRVAEPDKVLDHRKVDDSGWWLTDGSGLDDHAFVDGWMFTEVASR